MRRLNWDGRSLAALPAMGLAPGAGSGIVGAFDASGAITTTIVETAGDGGKGKGGGKRKRRGYTMSPAALAQRHTAAWKTGERAATAFGQALPPCKRSLCPMTEESGEKGNCSVKRHVEASGGAVERCAVRLVTDDDVRARLVKAIREGDLDGLAELQATLLAAMHGLGTQELAEVIREGLMIESEVFKDGEPVGTMQRTNPRAEPLLKLLDMLGATAAQQSITPKAVGERKRDEGIGGVLEMYKRRAAIASARAGSDS
jgi:hypothetical protein